MRERATELEYLKWFRCVVDFGPAHEDIVDGLNQSFIQKTGKNLPDGYNLAQDGETCIDKE